MTIPSSHCSNGTKQKHWKKTEAKDLKYWKKTETKGLKGQVPHRSKPKNKYSSCNLKLGSILHWRKYLTNLYFTNSYLRRKKKKAAVFMVCF